MSIPITSRENAKKKKTVKSPKPKVISGADKVPSAPRPPRKTATAGEAIAGSLTGRKPSKTIKNKSPRKSPPRAPERAPYVPPWEREDWGSKDLVTDRDPTGGKPTPPKYGRWQDAELPGSRTVPPRRDERLPSPPERKPSYGSRIGAPPGSMFTMDFRDSDRDGVDDRHQPGPGMPNPDRPSRGGRPRPQPERAPYVPPWKREGWGSQDLVNEGMPSRGGRPMPPRRSQPLYETIYKGRRPTRRSQPRYGRGGRNFLRSRMRR